MVREGVYYIVMHYRISSYYIYLFYRSSRSDFDDGSRDTSDASLFFKYYIHTEICNREIETSRAREREKERELNIYIYIYKEKDIEKNVESTFAVVVMLLYVFVSRRLRRLCLRCRRC